MTADLKELHRRLDIWYAHTQGSGSYRVCQRAKDSGDMWEPVTGDNWDWEKFDYSVAVPCCDAPSADFHEFWHAFVRESCEYLDSKGVPRAKFLARLAFVTGEMFLDQEATLWTFLSNAREARLAAIREHETDNPDHGRPLS